MSEKVKRIEWYLDELDCANCASKVETGIAKIEGILEKQCELHDQRHCASKSKRIKRLKFYRK